jgi:hypothetical protein
LKACGCYVLVEFDQQEESVLPPFIIEQIRQREERERARRKDQPQLELPLSPNRPAKKKGDDDEPDPDRGVIIVDLGG